MDNWKNKRVLVVGMARSGFCAADMLLKKGARVIVSDIKPEDQFDADHIAALRAAGCQIALGMGPEGFFDEIDMMVISPGIPRAAGFVQKALEKGIEVIGELELGARVLSGRLVAITGTNGKTTTTTLVGEIFKATGRPTHVCGNIGYPITAEAGETGKDDITVAEVSSYQCETIDRFHPDVAACLNITEDHLVRHGNMETYIAMKRRIFERQTKHDAAIFNYDDEACRKMAEGLQSHVLWFSRTQKVPRGAFVEDGTIYFKDEVLYPVCRTSEVRIPGPHNLENALAAVAITAALNVPHELMRQVLMSFAGVEHRIETVRELNGITYINDSKGTNVDSTLKAIDTMTKPTVLILGGSDKKVSFKALAEAIKACPLITDCVLIGDTAKQIEAELKAVGYTRYVHAGYDFDRCLELCRERAQKGGNILLSPACASFDMFTDFEHRGHVFKEKVMAFTE